MSAPEYANDKTYRTLGEFCDMIDVVVEYGDIEDVRVGINLETKTFSIYMPQDGSVLDNPAMVLASRIAWTLVCDSLKAYDVSGKYILESYCEQIGNGIYMLAEKMAGENISTNSSTIPKNNDFVVIRKTAPTINYFTPEQASQKLGVHVETVRRYIREGSLKAHKLGRRTIRIDEADLDEFVLASSGAQ